MTSQTFYRLVWQVNTMKLDHVAIWVVDIELMRTFYEK